jgi:hypothetical protein
MAHVRKLIAIEARSRRVRSQVLWCCVRARRKASEPIRMPIDLRVSVTSGCLHNSGGSFGPSDQVTTAGKVASNVVVKHVNEFAWGIVVRMNSPAPWTRLTRLRLSIYAIVLQFSYPANQARVYILARVAVHPSDQLRPQLHDPGQSLVASSLPSLSGTLLRTPAGELISADRLVGFQHTSSSCREMSVSTPKQHPVAA